jgi:hypothetical protein
MINQSDVDKLATCKDALKFITWKIDAKNEPLPDYSFEDPNMICLIIAVDEAHISPNLTTIVIRDQIRKCLTRSLILID